MGRDRGSRKEEAVCGRWRREVKQGGSPAPSSAATSSLTSPLRWAGVRLLVQEDAGEGPPGTFEEHPCRVRGEVADVPECRARRNYRTSGKVSTAYCDWQCRGRAKVDKREQVGLEDLLDPQSDEHGLDDAGDRRQQGKKVHEQLPTKMCRYFSQRPEPI